MAADPLAVLADVVIGDEPWPAETLQARAARISGLIQAQTGWDYPVDTAGLSIWGAPARDVDAQEALGLLRELAESSGAILFFDPGYDVSLFPEATRFRYASGDPLTGPDTYELEVSPRTYKSKGNVVNVVRVSYGSGDPRPSVTLSDPASIAAHLRRYRHIKDVILSAQAEAEQLAQATLNRSAWPVWQQTGATFSSSNTFEWQRLTRLQDPRITIMARSAADRDTLTEWRVLSGQLRLWHDQWDVTLDLQEVPA